MILRLILKKGEKIKTKDLTFFWVGTDISYEVKKIHKADMREIVEMEVLGVEVIKEKTDDFEVHK